MRYITVPAARIVPDVMTAPLAGSKDKPKPYELTLSAFIRDLSVAPEWRQDESWLNSLITILDAFDNAKPGDVVELEDAHHERLCAVFKGAQGITPLFMPTVARQMRNVLNAPKAKQGAPTKPKK